MSGQQLFFLDAVDDFTAGDEFIFSPDGSKIVVTTRGHDYVFDATNGRLLADLGEPGFTFSASFTADGSQLLTALVGSTVLWDIGGGGAVDIGVPIELAVHDAIWFNRNPVAVGPNLAAQALMTGDFGVAVATAVLDAQTGAVTGEIAGKGAQLPDGRFIIELQTPEGAEVRIGPVVIWDPETNTTTQLTDCSAIESSVDHVNPVECPRGEPLFTGPSNDVGVVASIDGSFVAAESYAPPGVQRRVRVWDATSFEVLAEFDVNDSETLYGAGPTWTVSWLPPTDELVVRSIPSGDVIATLGDGVLSHIVELSADASLLYVADWIGGVWIYDTSSWEVVATWQTHDAQHRGIAISPEGNRLATTAEDNFVKVWDVSGIRGRSSVSEPLPLLDRIPAPKPSDAAWLTEDRLVVFLADDAKWLEVSLSIDELVAAAQLRLTRSFSEGECAIYGIKPCPTLEEIRGR
jgi:WD40 repeat protein